jgi:predicted DNA-binding transcriptional regulator AlpA
MSRVPDPLIRPSDIADELGVSVGNLAQMRFLGTGPAYIKVGGKAVRYRRSDVDAWIEANRRTSTRSVNRAS